jgi:signal transduction histidine kinase
MRTDPRPHPDVEQARARIRAALRDGPEQRIRPAIDRLRLAQRSVRSDPDAAARLLRDARGEIVAGLAELQAVARGIDPVLLRERGLDVALRGLADECAVPVSVRGAVGGRLPAAVELTAYLVVAEGLRDADGDRVTVTVQRAAAGVVVDVVGCAHDRPGGGPAHIADRVRVLGGVLTVARGVLRAELPVMWSATPRPPCERA